MASPSGGKATGGGPPCRSPEDVECPECAVDCPPDEGGAPRRPSYGFWHSERSADSSTISESDSCGDSSSSDADNSKVQRGGVGCRVIAARSVFIAGLWLMQALVTVALRSNRCYGLEVIRLLDGVAWWCFVIVNIFSGMQWLGGFKSPMVTEVWRYLALTWVQMIFAMAVALPACTGWMAVRTVGLVVWNTTAVFRVVLYTGLLVRRLELTEAAFGANFRSRLLRRCRRLLLVALAASLGVESLYMETCTAEDRHDRICELSRRKVLDSCVMFLGVFLCGGVTIGALTQVIRSVQLPSGRDIGYLQAEAAWARRVLLRLRLSVLIPTIAFCSLCASTPLQRVPPGQPWAVGFTGLASTVGATIECVCLVFVVGLFQEQRPELPLTEGKRRPQRMKTVSSDFSWDAKVRELANRSISVAELLHFYALLGASGEVMKHFDPHRSTTNDVVRHAVIPLSRTETGGLAFASMGGSENKAMPHRMVTHTWSNKFLHLVAAVVADALGEQEYRGVAKRLTQLGGKKGLEQQLMSRGTLERRYWICAFCVNQHASICGSLPAVPPESPQHQARWESAVRDTVARERLPLCGCKQPKYLNDRPAECEMNKFDCMMAVLHEEVEGFGLLVAVDEKFDLFNRAWCVAELVESYLSDIPMSVCLLSNEALDIDADDLTVFRQLATLSVQSCEASRPQDKAEILAKIPDVDVFDAQLQRAIFGDRGLLQSCFVGFGVLEAAARSARRISMVAQRPSPPRRQGSLVASVFSNHSPEGLRQSLGGVWGRVRRTWSGLSGQGSGRERSGESLAARSDGQADRVAGAATV